MKTTFLFFSILLASMFNASCQSVEKKLLKVDFLLPGITFEKGISKKSSIVVSPMLGFGFASSVDGYYFDVSPNLALEYRYYYNLKRRFNLKKKTDNNTGNFFAAKAMMVSPSILNIPSKLKHINNEFYAAIGAVYGIQRTYDSGIYILYEGGMGINLDDSEVGPLLTFKIGYIIGKNK